MVKFKIICPDCEAVVITHSPHAMVWELCPSCKRHVWDIYDALMAEVYVPHRETAGARDAHAN